MQIRKKGLLTVDKNRIKPYNCILEIKNEKIIFDLKKSL
jgi:hypothetical protein